MTPARSRAPPAVSARRHDAGSVTGARGARELAKRVVERVLRLVVPNLGLPVDAEARLSPLLVSRARASTRGQERDGRKQHRGSASHPKKACATSYHSGG